jgi:hypothetical protein
MRAIALAVLIATAFALAWWNDPIRQHPYGKPEAPAIGQRQAWYDAMQPHKEK